MANLSLARIMYGTSEDFRASTGTSTTARSTLSAQSVSENSHEPAAEHETLGELLHRAWTHLSSKH